MLTAKTGTLLYKAAYVNTPATSTSGSIFGNFTDPTGTQVRRRSTPLQEHALFPFLSPLTAQTPPLIYTDGIRRSRGDQHYLHLHGSVAYICVWLAMARFGGALTQRIHHIHPQIQTTVADKKTGAAKPWKNLFTIISNTWPPAVNTGFAGANNMILAEEYQLTSVDSTSVSHAAMPMQSRRRGGIALHAMDLTNRSLL